MSPDKQSVQVIVPDAGKAVSMMGDSYRIVISGAATQNEFAVIDMLVPPGGGPNPHAHKDIHESFYVMEGEVEFMTENGPVLAGAGTTVLIPKGGAVHNFKNKSDKLARLWCTVVPAGLDQFFEEVGTPGTFGTFLPPAPLTGEDISRLEHIAAKYGQEIYPPDYWEKKK
ncbi:cupin domain-containing protein [Chitinophaga pinensis]|uniref:Cupin 2 conserved barrel domain protein n=1 Tax=Chitinophaga pinensis (strain ATCC 43595 / DSM 2588 / LMG 13176 / NBRC 15968 / NCIMB 11800 / UQM 2034) TaxID=485918 RepID=A0A979GQW1_CHIPD|nr:cupin domain-containing protein [Chitinophaga pinensis]ACU61852.1 Cupin 2 conserved barrel domain protein [Chitinophaga pinensis DSM 2588]